MSDLKLHTLGVMPKWCLEEGKIPIRIEAILSAIQRRMDAVQEIPNEWVEEYNELLKKRKSLYESTNS